MQTRSLVLVNNNTHRVPNCAYCFKKRAAEKTSKKVVLSGEERGGDDSSFPEHEEVILGQNQPVSPSRALWRAVNWGGWSWAPGPQGPLISSVCRILQEGPLGGRRLPSGQLPPGHRRSPGAPRAPGTKTVPQGSSSVWALRLLQAFLSSL